MEDYSQIPQNGPSINRKGGIRLHPVRDGLIPLVREAGIRERDSGGNVYTEITNATTGFCIGVTSPLTIEGGPVLESTPVVPTHNPKRDSGLLPQLDVNSGTWFEGSGSSRRTVRTVDMGDEALPSIPPRRNRAPRRGTAPSAPRARETATPAPNAGHVPALPNTLVDAWIMGTAKKKAKGRPVPPFKITPLMRKLARAEIARQADIARYCQPS